MSNDLIVIATLGASDLQFLVFHEGKRKKASPKNVGEVRRALRETDVPFEWWLPDGPTDELLEHMDHSRVTDVYLDLHGTDVRDR